MERKGQASDALGTVLGVVVLLAVLIVGFLVAGAMRDTTSGSYTTADAVVNYATDFSADRVVNYTVSNAVYASAGLVRVSFDNTSGTSNVTVAGSTTALVSSPQNVTVPASAIPEDGVVAVQYAVASGENITDSNLTYTQFSGCQLDSFDMCETADNTMDMVNSGFSVLPILMIISVAVAVIGAVVALAGKT